MIFPFFYAFFPFFYAFFPFFYAFFLFFLRVFPPFSPKGQRQTTAIYCKNGEFHSDPVCTDPVQTSRLKLQDVQFGLLNGEIAGSAPGSALERMGALGGAPRVLREIGAAPGAALEGALHVDTHMEHPRKNFLEHPQFSRAEKPHKKKIKFLGTEVPRNFSDQCSLILPIFSAFSVGGGPKVPRTLFLGTFFSYFRWFFSFRNFREHPSGAPLEHLPEHF